MKKLFDSSVKKSENIKIKCPLCKERIPSNATRCSRCAGDLTSKEAQANIEDQLKKWRKAVIVGTISFLSLFLFIFLIVVLSPSSNTPSSSVSVGQQGYLRNSSVDTPILLASDENAFKQLIKSYTAHDTAGVLELVAQGRAFGVNQGTQVLVIDSGLGKRKVRILQGAKPVDDDKVGRTGWVPMEWVVAQ